MERQEADLLAAAVEEITALLRLHYPEVRVETVPGDRPGSLQLVVIADVEDPEEVLAVVNERLRAWAARGGGGERGAGAPARAHPGVLPGPAGPPAAGQAPPAVGRYRTERISNYGKI